MDQMGCHTMRATTNELNLPAILETIFSNLIFDISLIFLDSNSRV